MLSENSEKAGVAYADEFTVGTGLKARNSNAQEREAVIGRHILNRMAELGRPESDAVVS